MSKQKNNTKFNKTDEIVNEKSRDNYKHHLDVTFYI